LGHSARAKDAAQLSLLVLLLLAAKTGATRHETLLSDTILRALESTQGWLKAGVEGLR
jgi:hypothetical protein